MIKTIRRSVSALLLGLFVSASAHAANGYEEVPLPQPTNTDGKIEVMEFFWYGCPHCYAFHPLLEDWRKDLPDDVAASADLVELRTEVDPDERRYVGEDG